MKSSYYGDEMANLNRTSLKLISLAKKQQHCPHKFDLLTKAVKSPAFSTPERYKMDRDKSHFKRIQSYPDLDNSMFASILNSPPRMVRQCRTVFPRKLLVPIRIFKSEYLQIDKEDKFNYLLVPIAPGMDKDNRDISFYYPSNWKLFEMNDNENKISSLNKGIIILPPSKEGTNIDKIGWPNKNRRVFEKLTETVLLKKLKSLEIDSDSLAKPIVKIIDSIENKRTFYVDDHKTPVININKIPIHDQIQVRSVSITENNKPFLINLLQYCIYYN